jgi:hypothetical protein
MPIAEGTFEVEFAPPAAELDGRVARKDFTKAFAGGLEGAGRGLMLSGGDPATGAAGYVAIETFDGTLDGVDGGFALQQLGAMSEAGMSLRYAVVPGSGQGGLEGISGELELTIEADGTHRYALDYEL